MGRSLLREFRPYQAEIKKSAFERAVGAGHFTLDPITGRYYNRGTSDIWDPNSWEWTDETWNTVGAPSGRKG